MGIFAAKWHVKGETWMTSTGSKLRRGSLGFVLLAAVLVLARTATFRMLSTSQTSMVHRWYECDVKVTGEPHSELLFALLKPPTAHPPTPPPSPPLPSTSPYPLSPM